MRAPAFFVQNNRVERLTVPVATYARARGIALHDRSSTAALDVDNCGIEWGELHPVLPYGSVQFLNHVKKSTLAPYVLHDEQQFSALTWTDKLGPVLLNGAGQLVRAAEVLALLGGGARHIRPLSEDKAFNAKAFDEGAWCATQAERDLSPELACWASPLRDIAAEWRCWVVGGRMVAASQYRKDGKLHCVSGAPTEVSNFVDEVACTWLPAPCVVVDVAMCGKTLKVVEFNSMHCSGWYAVDVGLVLDNWLAWSVAQAQ